MKHFLKETDFTPQEVLEVFSIARQVKQDRYQETPRTLDRQTWALIFSKSSTRTRVSFEVAVHELGGRTIYLNRNDIQLGRGESIQDTARVLSRYIHGLIIRTYDHQDVVDLAQYGSIPVVNALTDFLHPCQIYADAFTLAEQWSEGEDYVDALKGRKIAFIGDTNSNVANSLILGSALFGMSLSLSGPENYKPGMEIRQLLKKEGFEESFQFNADPREAVENADAVYTDVWVSMGKEDEAQQRLNEMLPYQVNSELMAVAKKDAIFMHCLPAHVGHEVTSEVMESPCSVVWDQAENRLHMQKAILSLLGRNKRQ